MSTHNYRFYDSEPVLVQVGKPFPFDKQMAPGDAPRAMTRDTFFDIVISLSNPASQEKKAVDRDKFKYGLFVYREVIPFFLVAWEVKGRLAMAFEVSLTIDKMSAGFREAWLEAEDANAIGMFLVNTVSNVTEAMRFFGVNRFRQHKRADFTVGIGYLPDLQ